MTLIDLAPIEYEDGYPEDEEFSAVAAMDPKPSFEAGAAWLLRELDRAAQHMPCFFSTRRGRSLMDKPVLLIDFSTGGWSGAESIIALIERRVDLRYHMLSWKRGGHYVFEVPMPARRDIADVRREAWATRRAKYGPAGHRGSYARGDTLNLENARG
jgi:hypothetical protein